MGVRAGIDLVDIADVDIALEQWGARYLTRIFTSSEIAASTTAGGTLSGRRLAEVFAAKEAAFKVLLADDDERPWQSVEVSTQEAGRLSLHLSGAAEQYARREEIVSLSLSVTSRQDHAAAVVLAETREPQPRTTTKDVEAP